ncbi:cyclodeaminase/cyclohydrolase family protein [Aliirhizobium smilacinae]|uniref:Cyclodeaminase/cyclohydrolase domain-containing protein n=1 Tax=Aliirhizobium smilacinae TaxID=1395944 RepID=A0A5C4XPJ8_9HYPH|nr:cyclodeaminase/cyclohydrolase family protein [Rhizobium smilacinae]TNM65218.1 hypothetical protein FHP24_02730 [Rhizobium smilacinae]
MDLLDHTVNELLDLIGRSSPQVSGSTAALLTSEFGIAMCKMALLVSSGDSAGNEITVVLLDSISRDISAAATRDRASVLALIETMKLNEPRDVVRPALIEATRQPLLACHLLVEALELLARYAADVDPSVASDYYAGTMVISTGFKAVIMAVDANLKDDRMGDLRDLISVDRAGLSQRHGFASNSLKRGALNIGFDW